jgi:uncharacterized lipoprotein YddW (UPF0748 family)
MPNPLLIPSLVSHALFGNAVFDSVHESSKESNNPMRIPTIVFSILAYSLLTAIIVPVSAEGLSVRGLFLASTGPRSEYAEQFWWEQSEEELSVYLDRLQSAGFNEVYPGVYGHGNYFFKTRHAVITKGVVPDRLPIDPLAVLVAEAHARDMKVIPFFPFLVAGGEPYVKQSAGGTLPNLDWYCVDTDGARGKTLSFDPANPEVRDYLGHLVEDLLAYEIDGIMLDYIRYLGSHMGYTPLARETFEAKHGADPLDLLYRPETFSENLVYCLKPTGWAGKPWYLSTLITTLNHLRAPFKIVDEEGFTAATLPKQGTLIIGSYYDLPAPLIVELNAFVADGGNVIFLDAPTTAMKKHESALGPILGMTSASRYAGRQARTLAIEAEHPITDRVEGSAVMCSANALTTITPDTAQVLARFDDGSPAVILSRLGAGHGILFNFEMLLNYNGESGLELLGNALRWSLAKGGGDPGAARLAELNAAWTQWRCDQVTEVVGMVRGIVDAKRPGLLLGAAVTPRRLNVIAVFQEWKTWVERDYIDLVYPMDYFGDDHDLKTALSWQIEGVDPNRIVPLLPLYRRTGGKTLAVDGDNLNGQLDILEGYDVHGAGVFSNQRYAPALEEALSTRWRGN